jgi:hypothetical protein
MSIPTFGSLAAAIKSDLNQWLKTNCQLLRLDVLEKTSAVASLLLYGLLLLNLVFFALLFAFLALGFLLGSCIDSLAGGFGLITLLYLGLLGLLFVCRKPLLTRLRNLFLKTMDPDLVGEFAEPAGEFFDSASDFQQSSSNPHAHENP